MIVIGHRGVRYAYPENTLAGLRAAFDLGYDGVEFDVRLTRDGVPVIVHDATLDRVAGISIAVGAATWAEIRERTAGGPAPVAALAEVLAELVPRGWLDIEVKEAGAAAAVLETLGAGRPLDRVVVSSFLLEAAERIARDGRVPAWLNAPDPTPAAVAAAVRAGAAALIVPAERVSVEAADRVRSAGLAIGGWGGRSPGEVRRLADLGARVAIPDLPLLAD